MKALFITHKKKQAAPVVPLKGGRFKHEVIILLSPLSPFSGTSSPRTQSSASKQQKIPISLSQLYKDIQALPEGLRDQLVPREDLFMELSKPVHVSPWKKASAALKRLSIRHPFRVTLKNMVSAWKSPPKKRLNFIKTILLTSSNSFDKRNNEYLKEALRMGNQPLFNVLLRKAENPDLAPLIKRSVIDGNERAFSEIIKKIDKSLSEEGTQFKPLPKETMNWLAEYGKPQKLAALLEKMPPNSYTDEERQAWTSLAESQHGELMRAKKQFFNKSEAQVSEVLRHINAKAEIKKSLDALPDQNGEQAQILRNQLTQLRTQDVENQLRFMVHSQNIDIQDSSAFFFYVRVLKKALQAKDHASLGLMLNIPKFRLEECIASDLPVTAASMGNLEGLQLVLDTPRISVNQMANSQTPLHAAVQQGHKEIVEYLLKKISIQTNLKDGHGKTVLDIAKEKNHQPIVELLESHKAK